MPVPVLIYEDNDDLRESLCSLLSLDDSYTVAGAFSSCERVTENIIQCCPEVILMDIDLPGINGIEAVKTIRLSNRQVQIIMLTVFDDTAHVFDALQAGANGYLLKKNISDKLTAAIQEVLHGGAPMSPAIARMVIDKLQIAPAAENKYLLTAREKDILSLLSKGNSHKMIAASLDISIETVRSHIKHIYDKLQVHSQTEAISKAFREKMV